MTFDTPEDLIRSDILALNAYHVPPPGDMIKLDAMENPYDWPVNLKQAWLDSLCEISLNRYPDAAASAVKAQLQSVMKLPAEMPLILGNGSDELIQMLALTLNGSGRPLLAPEPGFVMYAMIAKLINMPYVGVPLNPVDFSLDMDAMLAAIEQHQPALVFLACPNNPTGNLFNMEQVQTIIEATPGIVVVDEAYAPFTDGDFTPWLGRYPNLLVMRTVSKLGLAGLRLGLLSGPAHWLTQIEKIRLPYNINVLTQASAIFALRHYSILQAQTQQIREQRSLLFQQMNALPNVHVWPSEANFLLFRVADALAVFEVLKAQGILIKKLHGSHPLLDQCLRVTVGKPIENQKFMAVIERL